MNEKYIPIIGEISAGKSTFLKSFLGIEVLQTGAVTTTKFVCLNKVVIKYPFTMLFQKNIMKFFLKKMELN